MSDAELNQKATATIKKVAIAVVTAAIIAIGGIFFTALFSTKANSQDIMNMKSIDEKLSIEIEKKVDKETLEGLKSEVSSKMQIMIDNQHQTNDLMLKLIEANKK